MRREPFFLGEDVNGISRSNTALDIYASHLVAIDSSM